MTSTRGILRPTHGLARFDLDRVAPPDDLAPFVQLLWTVRWDLPPGESFAQEILPFPCVNLACEEGRFQAHGPGTRRFMATLTGQGWVAGVRFRPASFSAFAACPMRRLVDAVLPAVEAMGKAPPPAPDAPEAARAALVDYLRGFGPPAPDPALDEVNRLVDRTLEDRSIRQAEDLARVAGVSLRSLHRLLQRYVGVSSKWIVRRARVQDAADRVARGEGVDWAEVAQALGYHDQAHLIRDFKAQIGFTPAAYARRCAER
jgi:AraC-like DNA-binding protein